MLTSVGILSPSRGSEIKRLTSSDTMDGSDLPCYILWPTRTVEQSFWCIDAWKGDWVRLGEELNTSSMPSALTHKGLGEQPHAKLWAFPPAMFQRIPILNRCMRISFRLPQGEYQLKGRHLLTQDMVAREESGSDAESGWSGVSDNSSTDSECTILEASWLWTCTDAGGWLTECCTVHLPGHEKLHRLCQICPGQRPLMRCSLRTLGALCSSVMKASARASGG